MHGAPSVIYPVGRSVWAAAILAGTWVAGAVASLGWLLAGATASRAALAALALLGCAGWAVVAWRRHPAGLLAWDGASWALDAAGAGQGESGRLRVALDLQRVLLVHWRAPSGGHWLWLERGRLPGRWDALRRAVYSRAERDALSGAEPPSARP